MNRRPLPRREEGSALILALVFVLVMGLIILALLAQTTSNLKTTQVVQTRTDKIYASDAGLEQAIEELRLDRTVCAQLGDSGALPNMTVNGQVVERKCTTEAGLSSGVGGYAAILTSATSGLVTSGPGSKQMTGPIVAANLVNPDMTLDSGNAYEQQGVGCTSDANKPAQLIITPSPPFRFKCSSLDPNTLAASIAHGLPTAPPAAVTGTATQGDTTTYPNCRVFSPGTYATITLGGNTYFRTGTYYFNGAVVNLTGKITGGKPDPDEEVVNTLPPQCAPAQAADAGVGTGVKFIFGGVARFDGDAQLELFSRLGGPASEGQMGISVQTATATNGFTASAIPAGEYLLRICCGNGPTLAIHGSVYAPSADMNLRIVNRQKAVLQGGVVLRQLTLNSPASSDDGPYVSVATSPVTRTLVVTSTVKGASGDRDVVATAVIDLDNNNSNGFRVTSWRIE